MGDPASIGLTALGEAGISISRVFLVAFGLVISLSGSSLDCIVTLVLVGVLLISATVNLTGVSSKTQSGPLVIQFRNENCCPKVFVSYLQIQNLYLHQLYPVLLR